MRQWDSDNIACNKAWCYVDPDNCDNENFDSGFYPGLTYSFDTCLEDQREP